MSVWTDNEIKYLTDNYKYKTKKELALFLNKTECAIQLKASRLGLKKDDLYCYNKKYFNNITTPNQAYWLGFIYADGYITSNKAETKYILGIELNKDDYLHLKKFNRCIEGNVNVSFKKKRKGSYINGKRVHGNDICIIRLFCTELCKDLINHGVVKNKSLIKCQPKLIPEYLMRDFIRGYFDGNGTICYSYNKNVNRSYLKVSISTGSEKFANWLLLYLNKINYSATISKDKNAFKIFINNTFGENNKVNFLDYIYKDSEMYLDRKYKKYLYAVYDESGQVIINN